MAPLKKYQKRLKIIFRYLYNKSKIINLTIKEENVVNHIYDIIHSNKLNKYINTLYCATFILEKKFHTFYEFKDWKKLINYLKKKYN